MIKYISSLFICIAVFAAVNAHAQLRVNTLQKVISTAQKSSVRWSSVRPLLQGTKITPLHNIAVARAARPLKPGRAVFTVGATPTTKKVGSAFAVNIDGTVWGITARHVMDDIFHTPHITLRDADGNPFTLAAEPFKEGSVAGADVAIFKIPQEALPYLQPLELSENLPEVNSVLSSSGFAHGNFLFQPRREVLFSSNHRILTKYESFNAQESGYCGSPLLDSNGKVVAVHIGSKMSDQLQKSAWYSGTLAQFDSQMHSISLAVPATWLRALAHQTEGVAVVFDGLPILSLRPQDSITSITQLRGGRVLKTLPNFPFMDLDHLETFFDVLPGDTFRLEVQTDAHGGFPRKAHWYEWTAGENNVTKTLKK